MCQAVSGRLVSAVSGRAVWAVSGRLVSAVSGRAVSAVSGRLVSAVSGRLVWAVSGRLVSDVSGRVVWAVSEAVPADGCSPGAAPGQLGRVRRPVGTGGLHSGHGPAQHRPAAGALCGQQRTGRRRLPHGAHPR